MASSGGGEPERRAGGQQGRHKKLLMGSIHRRGQLGIKRTKGSKQQGQAADCWRTPSTADSPIMSSPEVTIEPPAEKMSSDLSVAKPASAKRQSTLGKFLSPARKSDKIVPMPRRYPLAPCLEGRKHVLLLQPRFGQSHTCLLSSLATCTDV